MKKDRKGINRVKNIPDVKVSPDAKIKIIDADPVNVPDAPKLEKKFFRDTAFGRTLSLKNRTGKVAAGVLTTAVALVTGINLNPIIELITGVNEMDFLTEFGLTEGLITLIVTLVTAGISWLRGYYKLPKVFVDKIIRFIHVAADEIKKATDEESEKGKDITKNEIYEALIRTFKRMFGVNPEELKSAK